jgi:RNA polymerase sigma factor (sigma-70 family)
MAEANAGSAVGADDLTDELLLESYVSRREEAAFAALVRRYGPLVLSVCRRVLHHEQDAEDAFQAVFCVLARKAGSIRKRAAVGAWLHGVAYRIARKARARKGRHRVSETDLRGIPAAEGSPEWVWRELRPILDQEVNRLPRKYRQAFVLCNLEGQTNEQAAVQLGCPLGTVLSRLARARERLRVRLTRRGLALSAGALAAALESHAAGATVQAGLAKAAVHAGVRYGAGQPVAAGIAALADGFLKALSRARLTSGLGLVSALGLVVVFLLWFPWRGAGPAASPEADREKLQGSWQVVSIEKVGQLEANPEMKFVFADNQLTLIVAGIRTPPMLFVLDPSQEPKAIDYSMPAGKVLRGIYQVDGDSLQLCLDYDVAGTGGKRPTAFRPQPDAPVLVLRRERAEPDRP